MFGDGALGVAHILAMQQQQNAFNSGLQNILGQYGQSQVSKYEIEQHILNQQMRMQVEAPKLKQAAPTETKVNNELLPDISLARVFKWAIVLIVAMALGRKVWDQFGPAITSNMHKALGAAGIEGEKTP